MKILTTTINTWIVFCAANIYSLPAIREHTYLVVILTIGFVLVNITPSFYKRKMPTLRLRVCGDGCELLIIFLISTFLSTMFFIFRMHFGLTSSWIVGLLFAIVMESIVFWNGIVRVYITSLQLAIKWRLIGILCGWIPIVHLFVLCKIIHIVLKETAFESAKIWINIERQKNYICRTKYPLLLVHGVFFRDFKYLNYWGRIPSELERNGAIIYYGNQQSAASVADCGKEISERISQIVHETGCKKVNIIAHSKGGLDCRYAISKFGAEKWVASVTTINTPHRGCLFAEYLLSKIPESSRDFIAQKYNLALKKLGDNNPDFLAAVNDLTVSSCKKRNETIVDAPNVFYQSVGSKLNKATSGKFPLNFSYHLVKHFDGLNDGLVSIDSFTWGETSFYFYIFY
ncbi:esterase/lipase family protein [Anaerovorax sp. IOR16]|uniref:esterase/lipase family protein n=1 Tax=Anaerovorax sp. IOR16 TaxID=2773458 RepID=UPI0019D2F664|nr:triacylglycerol lipase [Anaerovorax sp. IOR16]